MRNIVHWIYYPTAWICDLHNHTRQTSSRFLKEPSFPWDSLEKKRKNQSSIVIVLLFPLFVRRSEHLTSKYGLHAKWNYRPKQTRHVTVVFALPSLKKNALKNFFPISSFMKKKLVFLQYKEIKATLEAMWTGKSALATFFLLSNLV